MPVVFVNACFFLYLNMIVLHALLLCRQ